MHPDLRYYDMEVIWLANTNFFLYLSASDNDKGNSITWLYIQRKRIKACHGDNSHISKTKTATQKMFQ